MKDVALYVLYEMPAVHLCYYKKFFNHYSRIFFELLVYLKSILLYIDIFGIKLF